MVQYTGNSMAPPPNTLPAWAQYLINTGNPGATNPTGGYANSMGLPTLGYVPPPVLDSMYPYLTYPSDLAQAQALAQLGEQGAYQRAMMAASAQRAGDTARAGATVDAARLAAQGGIQQANIGALAQLRALQPTLQLQASVANQGTLQNLAQMMGSGQLRDAIGARLALYGQGAMPGIASALNGMPSPWITAPSVNMSGFSSGGLGGGGGNYGGNYGSSSGYSGGGGGALDINSLFNSAYGNVRNTVGAANPFTYASGAPGSPAPAPTPTAVDAMRRLQSGDQASANAILRQVAGLPPNPASLVPSGTPTPTSSPGYRNPAWEPLGFAGGTPDAGKAYLVGDGAGVIPGVTEVMRVNKEGVEVIPIEGGAAAGLWGPSPGAGSPGYDTWKASQIPDSPEYNTAKASTVGRGVYRPYQGSAQSMFPTTPYRPGVPSGRTYDASTWGSNLGALAGLRDLFSGRSGGTVTGSPMPPTWVRDMSGRLIPIQGGMATGGTITKSGLPDSVGTTKPLTTSTPTATTPKAITAPVTKSAPQQGILSDVNSIPALQMLRTGQMMPAFGLGPRSFSEPGLGITNVPASWAAANTLQAQARTDPQAFEDSLQILEFLGVPRMVALNQMAQATPGYRSNQVRAYSF